MTMKLAVIMVGFIAVVTILPPTRRLSSQHIEKEFTWQMFVLSPILERGIVPKGLETEVDNVITHGMLLDTSNQNMLVSRVKSSVLESLPRDDGCKCQPRHLVRFGEQINVHELGQSIVCSGAIVVALDARPPGRGSFHGVSGGSGQFAHVPGVDARLVVPFQHIQTLGFELPGLEPEEKSLCRLAADVFDIDSVCVDKLSGNALGNPDDLLTRKQLAMMDLSILLESELH